jgi:hypothetical protein
MLPLTLINVVVLTSVVYIQFIIIFFSQFSKVSKPLTFLGGDRSEARNEVKGI